MAESTDTREKAELEELLQELRVALPGVQVLLAVLLTIPFDSRFTELDDVDRALFFTAIVGAACATVLLIAPSAHHRFAWPTPPSETQQLIRIGTVEARLGMLALAWTITAAAYVVAELVFGGLVALATAAVVGVLAIILWVVYPRVARRHHTTAFA